MEILVTTGTLDVSAGTVICQYQRFKSNASTGSHAHWSVDSLETNRNGVLIETIIGNAQWANENGLSALFQPDIDAQNYTGLTETLNPEEGRQLYREHNPEIYYNWRGRTNFNVPGMTSQAEYTFWEEHLNFLRRDNRR